MGPMSWRLGRGSAVCPVSPLGHFEVGRSHVPGERRLLIRATGSPASGCVSTRCWSAWRSTHRPTPCLVVAGNTGAGHRVDFWSIQKVRADMPPGAAARSSGRWTPDAGCSAGAKPTAPPDCPPRHGALVGLFFPTPTGGVRRRHTGISDRAACSAFWTPSDGGRRRRPPARQLLRGHARPRHRVPGPGGQRAAVHGMPGMSQSPGDTRALPRSPGKRTSSWSDRPVELHPGAQRLHPLRDVEHRVYLQIQERGEDGAVAGQRR